MVILSAGVGALAGVVTTAWKSRKDLEVQYDIDLRERRIEAYAELWRLLEPLADYFEPGAVTRASARELGQDLRRWYFNTGGLVLSAATRPAYFNLQQALEGVSASGESGGLGEERVEIVKALASRLRTTSTRDVATRVGSRLGPSIAARLSAPWRRSVAPLRVSVDRRWRWSSGTPEPALFVVVENVTDRDLEVLGVDVAGAGTAVSAEGETGLILQPGENRELTAAADDALAPEVTVRLAGRRAFRSGRRPGVPLQSHLLGADSPGRHSERRLAVAQFGAAARGLPTMT